MQLGLDLGEESVSKTGAMRKDLHSGFFAKKFRRDSPPGRIISEDFACESVSPFRRRLLAAERGR